LFDVNDILFLKQKIAAPKDFTSLLSYMNALHQLFRDNFDHLTLDQQGILMRGLWEDTIENVKTLHRKAEEKRLEAENVHEEMLYHRS
jgi:hypothetical protein